MNVDLAQLAGIGAIVAIGLGVGVLGWTVLRGKRSAAASIDPEQGVNSEQARLLADMKELTGRLATELEAKSVRLEKLLAEAERRSRELERGARAEPQPVVVTPAARMAPRVEPMHARVHELADQGLTPVQIAETTGVPTGQVELVLALRRAGAGRS